MWRAPYAIVFGDRNTDYRYAFAAGIPYVLIENDLATARGQDFPAEREMIENAAAVLFTSEEHLDYCDQRYRLPPSEVVYLRPLNQDLEFEPLAKLPGQNIAYAGGIYASDKESSVVGYRTYHSIFQDLIDYGWTVHIYPAPICRDHVSEYAQMGCVIHEPVPEAELYREMSQYQAGLQAYAAAGPQDYISTCRPNKIWNYLASGIPTLGINTGRAGAVYDGKWGIVADGDLVIATRRVLAMEISETLRRSEVMDDDLAKFGRLVDRIAAPKS
jgi:hypothetical protein